MTFRATPEPPSPRRPRWRHELVAWWSRAQDHAPPGTSPSPAADAHTAHAAGAPETTDPEATTLWRMRATVRDEPGTLAALCAALAGRRVDILALQTHPLTDGTVDEFLLRAPEALPSTELSDAVAAAGGSDAWVERADAHDLVDAPTRALTLATRTALDAAELPLALRQLFGRCTIHSVPAKSFSGRSLESTPPAEGVLEETVMRLRDPSGGAIIIERPYCRSPRPSSPGPARWSSWTPGSARGSRTTVMC
ncbi:N-acetyltransferase domain-containing protein OS=Streptomyces antimycoticus OX=68175 GN=SANT12839_082340 PE=4 SV=1 [Streptomyces antimycoticus]